MSPNNTEPEFEEQEEAKGIHLIQLWINLYIRDVSQFAMMISRPELGFNGVTALVKEICKDDDQSLDLAKKAQALSGLSVPFTEEEVKEIILSALGAALLTVCRPGLTSAKELSRDCDNLISKIIDSGKSPMDFVYFLNRGASGDTQIRVVPIDKLKRAQEINDTETGSS